MNVSNVLERMFWTVLSAAGSSLLAAPLLDVDAGKAAAIAAGTAAINFLTLLGRKRLEVLPE